MAEVPTKASPDDTGKREHFAATLRRNFDPSIWRILICQKQQIDQ